MQYLNPPNIGDALFEPPCSIFTRQKCPYSSQSSRILELGSGNGHLCLQHLAPLLPPGSQLILTDLEEVMPLLSEQTSNAISQGIISTQVDIRVEPLPWGSRSHLDRLRARLGYSAFTQVICSDLVYFTHLLEPLLETLLWLTEDEASSEGCRSHQTEVIFGCKPSPNSTKIVHC